MTDWGVSRRQLWFFILFAIALGGLLGLALADYAVVPL